MMAEHPYGTLSATLFYNHLDSCTQCRERPFSLCRLGAQLLAAAAITHDGPEELNATIQRIRKGREPDDPVR